MSTPAPASARFAAVAYDRIKDRLLSGGYAPEERLSVEALRTEFNVSKQPVMEALRLLSADGLIEIVPQVGSRVRSYTDREMADFYTVFAQQEATIAAAAAVRCTQADLAGLERATAAIDALEHATVSDAGAQYRALNRQVHVEIHRLAESSLMVGMARRMWDLSDFFLATSGALPRTPASVAARNREHHAVVAAIRAGDAASAYREMQTHLLAIIDTLGISAAVDAAQSVTVAPRVA